MERFEGPQYFKEKFRLKRCKEEAEGEGERKGKSKEKEKVEQK